MTRLLLPGRTQKNRISRTRIVLFATVLVLALAGGTKAKAQTADGPHFSHQTIFVTDLDRAANFYEKVMELKRISEPFHDGKHVWFRISEHGQLHVVSGAREDIPHDINIHLAFSVTDMAAFTKHLDAMNVKYGNWAQNTKTPQLRPDKVQQIYLQDPDGYWIEVNDDKF
jgi:lactoylglutathione lyase